MVLTAGIKPSPPMEPANAARRWFYGGGAAASQDVRKPNSGDYAVRRIREAEKAEKIMHLICWGPTK